MARQCSNCGTDNLRNRARFCEICGAELAEGSSDDPKLTRLSQAIHDHTEEMTQDVPEAGTTDDNESSMVPSIENMVDEGATKAMPDSGTTEEDGATIVLPDFGAFEDDGATRAMPDASPPDDGSTRAMPEPNEMDKDQAVAASDETHRVDDDGQTKAMPGALEPSSESTTVATGETEITTTLVTDLKIGHILQDRYRLVENIGRGGFGAAYLAEDIKLNRICVVKQMLIEDKSLKDLEIYQANFEREARLLVQLNHPGHPNIPEIYDFFTDENGNYLVMKYIEGRSLKDALDQSHEAIPWRDAVRYGIDVCNAINYMHTQEYEPVMHRDIKPANILLGDDGRVWLVDFGLAKANPVEGSGDLIATKAFGSLGYTPLEQWLGEAVPRSDVYAVGATLHHLVTGLSPLDAYGGEFHIQKLKEMHGQFPAIRTADRNLPKQLEDIITWATTAEPDQRPTALQLQQQLEVLISGAQEAPLYTFKNGQSAKTVPELVDLCDKNRREAQGYLYNDDFKRWFLLINRNDLAEAADLAIQQSNNQNDGLEKFLKLILPNLLLRRVGRTSRHLARLAIQFILIFVAVAVLVVVGGSYVAGSVIQRTIGTISWDFSKLNLNEENRYTEEFLAEKFDEAAGVYFDNIGVDIQPPDKFDVNAKWNNVPLEASLLLRLGDKKPRFYLVGVNDIPLTFVGNNYISAGLNSGVDEAFQKAPVDVTTLRVEEEAVVFNVELSGRTPFATPTPTITPTPTPTVTPTPVNITLVIAFNELDQDIILEIDDNTWDIPANDSQVIELPPGTYDYTVKYRETEEIVARGTKTWVLNRAYRLRIDVLDQG